MFLEQENQHIKMISEESWDTEDWSNDADNSALHHMNKLHCKYIKMENSFLLYIWLNKFNN